MKKKWRKILSGTLVVLKIIGIIVIVILTGKFLTDFFGSKDKIYTELKNFKQKKWKKAKDDAPKTTVSENALTDTVINKEIDKLDGISDNSNI